MAMINAIAYLFVKVALLYFTDAHTEIEDQAAKCIELSKKKLLSRMQDSPIARTAVYQWNKLNTAVRILVHKTTVSILDRSQNHNYFVIVYKSLNHTMFLCSSMDQVAC